MKKLLCLVLTLALLVLAALPLGAAEVRRDAQGRILSVTTREPGGRATVLDAQGRVLEHQTTHAGTTTVRDARGRILRTETVTGIPVTAR